MRRRAIRFGRPLTYDQTLSLSVQGGDAANRVELDLLFDPVRQTVRPVIRAAGRELIGQAVRVERQSPRSPHA